MRPGSSLEIGESSIFGAVCSFDRGNAKVAVGSRSYVQGLIACADRITIGDDVLISSGGSITDHDSHAQEFAARRADVVDYIASRKDWSNVAIAAVTIESGVWIGYGVLILKGVTIGKGAVIGAGSVVTSSVPPNSVVVGNPARVIREIEQRDSIGPFSSNAAS